MMTTTRWTLRSRLLVMVMATVAVCALAGLAAAQNPAPNQTPGAAAQQKVEVPPVPKAQDAKADDTKTQDLKQEPAPSPVDQNAMLKLYACLFVGFAFMLFALDIVLAYASMWWARSQLMDRIGPGSLTDDQLKVLTTDITAGPPGISGLTRALIAFMLLLIIGVAVFHLVVTAPNARDLPASVDRILMLLAGALTSITGFYFGSKSAIDAQGGDGKAGVEKPAAAQENAAGSLVLDPPRGKPGDAISITGGGFGASRGTVTFGSTQAGDSDILAWTEALIKVKVPVSARPGQLNVILTKDDGHQLSTPSTAFTVIG
jgi:hypothetical protein